MTPEHFIKAQMCSFAHREAAHHGGMDNMLAMLFVLRNRQRAGWMGGSWMGILHEAHQCAATIYKQESAPDLRDYCFRTLLQKVDDIYSGTTQDVYTEGALYYAELNKVESDWFRKSILSDPEGHARVATVGNVSFFL